MPIDDWFLTPGERGNPDTRIDSRRDRDIAYSEGNDVTPLIHGRHYFDRLVEVLGDLEPDDWVHFTDWRGDADERMGSSGVTLAALLCGLAERGVHVRGLVWRSHPDQTSFSEEENQRLGAVVNEAGGEVLLDERVRRGGSHHQKLVLVRHPQNEDRDVAFVGGIDLCHGRNDDETHAGDPQPYPLDAKYGDTPAWHDVQLQIRGPAIGALAHTFRERWEDPAPLDHRNPWRIAQRKRINEPRKPDPLPPMLADPSPCGNHAVQVLRTYPAKRPRYPFARRGERSIARAYAKAFARARRFIYLEDQYLWSGEVASVLAQTLAERPELVVIAVVPRYPEKDTKIAGPPNRYGQVEATRVLKGAASGRFAVYDIENEAGTPTYVHAKVCVVDDVWAMVGSDNFNRRSWTHDSELSCAILDSTRDEREPLDPAGLGDGARRFARDLRMRLWSEHLGAAGDEGWMVDAYAGFEEWRRRAADLDAWHAGGGRGTRPVGRVRPHHVEHVSRLQTLWAKPVYRYAVDPDGRPRDLRRRNAF